MISRTSTQHYESAPKNLREIAKQLGVAHILEGSVQKRADTVRVNVQLIKASSDSHLWSDTFDRKLTDILLVETEGSQNHRRSVTRQTQQATSNKSSLPSLPAIFKLMITICRGLAYTLKTAFTPENSLGAQKYVKEKQCDWTLISL